MAGGKTIICRCCGAEVGPAPRCTSCGAVSRRRRLPGALKFFLAVLLFAAGVMLHRHYHHRPPRLIRISEIKPYMNFRKVCIEGRLTKPVRRMKSGALFFLVHDGTGQLAVFSETADEAAQLRAGSRIWAEGSLRVGVGNRRSLQAGRIEPHHVAQPSATVLADIRPEMAGAVVSVSGTVAECRTPEPGSRAPFRIVLEDVSGRLQVIHWLEQLPLPAVGDVVEVTGTVQVYRGRTELRVYAAQDVKGPWLP